MLSRHFLVDSQDGKRLLRSPQQPFSRRKPGIIEMSQNVRSCERLLGSGIRRDDENFEEEHSDEQA
jgi:hypothetical protein